MTRAGYNASEDAVRRRAASLGYHVVKSREHPHPDNQGLYMLIEKESTTCVLGQRYDATLEDIDEWLANKEAAR